jgi:hypothetical protein
VYSTRFVRGTDTPLQTLRIFINSLGSCHSLFDSQVTFVQVVCFSQEHTVIGRLAASTSSVRYQVPSLFLPSSRCTLDNTV